MVPYDVDDARLSVMSLAALEDQGYQVNYDAADFFAKTDLDSSCQCSSSGLQEGTFNRRSSKARVELSAEGHRKATESGRNFLKGFARTGREAEGFVGGDGVFVYYKEDGRVFTVYVTPE